METEKIVLNIIKTHQDKLIISFYDDYNMNERKQIFQKS